MLVQSGLECWDLVLGTGSSESALQLESSKAADFRRASAGAFSVTWVAGNEEGGCRGSPCDEEHEGKEFPSS